MWEGIKKLFAKLYQIFTSTELKKEGEDTTAIVVEDDEPAVVQPTEDANPEVEPPIENEKPEEIQKQKEYKFSCKPDSGEYLIDEKRASICGRGVIEGKGWIKRQWPPATNGYYHYITRTLDDGKGSVTWYPALRQDGRFDVFVNIPATYNRTSKAKYMIKHADGVAIVYLDQRRKAENPQTMVWRKLGTWRFDKAANPYVKLFNTGGHSEGADALAMKRVKE